MTESEQIALRVAALASKDPAEVEALLAELGETVDQAAAGLADTCWVSGLAGPLTPDRIASHVRDVARALAGEH